MISRFSRSLCDLLGEPYCRSVAEAARVCGIQSDVWRRANEQVPFVTEGFLESQDGLLSRIGEQVVDPFARRGYGAPSDSFKNASKLQASPIGGVGYIRIGEDGRCYLSAKSEHYHASLGHNFPGHRLLATAAEIGILNATHNNTRGYVTRLLEERLVEIANGGPRDGNRVLNRVINLETGSLAVEAGVKMMLARFYRSGGTHPQTPYSGRIPVFLVMGDFDGGKTANYHGTTMITQTFRDLWPDFAGSLEDGTVLKTVAVEINDIDDFRAKVAEYDAGDYKVAGFLHEIVLMNYGAILLEKEYLRGVYEICDAHDIPVLVDEIQSGIWYPKYFLYREYGLHPDMVAVGKGFPAGQYPSSKIITTPMMDTLDQFGALVTNGQEELASLAYLITIEFARENSGHIEDIGRYYEEQLAALQRRHREVIGGIEGAGLLSAIRFNREDDAVEFAKELNSRCVDISVHSYKPKCPPTALTKLPLISTENMIDTLVGHFDRVLNNS